MADRRLWLQTFESPLWTLFTLACVATAVVIIVWLYRTERSLVPPRIGKWLLGLRLGVLGLVLAAMLQPVLTRTHLLEQRGRIVIAVDVSDSMTTTDRQASPAEKLAWARALGMIGNASVNERLDRWAKELAARREPEWVLPTETSDPKQREELATVRKENLRGTLEAVDQLSRKEIARRLLLQSTHPLLAAIAEQGNIEVRLFGGEVADADPEKLGELVNTPPESVGPDSTSLSAAIGTDDTATASGPVRAFVLLTDGRDTARSQTVIAARKLGELETPVYSVLLGSTEPVRDLAIAEVDYPEVSFQDDSPRLSASIRAGGFTGKSIEVVLQPKEGEAVRQTLTVEGEVVPVEMPLPTHGLGRHEYTLSVTSLPGESREDNNSRDFGLNVVDDRIRVLLIEGEAGWEFRFIDNALSRDERIEVRQVVFDQPYLGLLPTPFFPRELSAADEKENPFAGLDLVIIGDVSPGRLTERVWEQLERFVAEEGSTLVLTAGQRYFPQRYRSKTLAGLLPIEDPHEFSATAEQAVGPPSERGIRLSPTPDGRQQLMLQFSADPAENIHIWQQLPGILRGQAGRAKPAATVFLSLAALDGRPTTLEQDRQNAVMAHQYFGFGQVVWLGIDSTWRWRNRVGDEYHHRFWGQLARWAWQNRAMAGNDYVKLSLDRSNIEAGENVLIRSRWTTAARERLGALTDRVVIYRVLPNGQRREFQTLNLQPSESQPLLHEGELIDPPAGEYQIVHQADGLPPGGDEVAATLYVHNRSSQELSDLQPDPQLLQELATVSGGRVFTPADASELPDLFRDVSTEVSIRDEIRLWDHWLILVLALSLLMAEWVLRKLHGLP